MRQEEKRRSARRPRKRVRRGAHLSGRPRVRVLERVRPDEAREPRAGLVARGKIERARKRDAVGARVLEDLLLHARELRRGVLEVGQARPPALREVDEPEVRGLRRRLATHHDLRPAVSEEADEALERVLGRLEEPARLAGRKVHRIEERLRAAGRCALTREERHDAVLHDRAAAAARRREDEAARILVRVLRREVEEDFRRRRGVVEVDHRRGPPAPAAVVLRHDRRPRRDGPLDVLEAVDELAHLPGLARERRLDRPERLAERHLLHGVAAVERLGPEERGFLHRLPLDAARARGDSLPRRLVREREVRDGPQDSPRAVPDLERVREGVERHTVRERTLHPRDEEIASVRRRVEPGVEPGCADGPRPLRRDVELDDLRRRVMTEQLLVSRALQEILERLDLGSLPGRLLDHRPLRDGGLGRRRPAIRRDREQPESA